MECCAVLLCSTALHLPAVGVMSNPKYSPGEFHWTERSERRKGNAAKAHPTRGRCTRRLTRDYAWARTPTRVRALRTGLRRRRLTDRAMERFIVVDGESERPRSVKRLERLVARSTSTFTKSTAPILLISMTVPPLSWYVKKRPLRTSRFLLLHSNYFERW